MGAVMMRLPGPDLGRHCRHPTHLDPSHLDPSHLDPTHLDPTHLHPSHLHPSHLHPSHLHPKGLIRVIWMRAEPARRARRRQPSGSSRRRPVLSYRPRPARRRRPSKRLGSKRLGYSTRIHQMAHCCPRGSESPLSPELDCAICHDSDPPDCPFKLLPAVVRAAARPGAVSPPPPTPPSPRVGDRLDRTPPPRPTQTPGSESLTSESLGSESLGAESLRTHTSTPARTQAPTPWSESLGSESL
jgi:hypothetical protein